MGVKAGVEPLALWEAVRQGATGRRRTFDALIDQFLPGKYDPPDFALQARAQGRVAGHRAGPRAGRADAHGQLALAEMTEALNRGWADRDSRVMMLLEQERAGIEDRGRSGRLKEALAKPFPTAPGGQNK